MTEPFNIHFLHGSYFTAEICFKDVVGRISVSELGSAYLCQDEIGLSDDGTCFCRDFLGYRFAWCVGYMDDEDLSVKNLKILPSPLEYHQLLTEAMSDCEKPGDAEAVVAKIAGFLAGIKVFEPKNPGK